MHNSAFYLIFCLSLFQLAGAQSQARSWQDWIPEFKPAVVSIQVNQSKYIGINSAGIYVGTGFITDVKKGLAVTNRHLVGASPSQIRMRFSDGSTTLAKLIYYDLQHDFSILQFNPEAAPKNIKSARLGNFFDLKVGDSLLLIGNNEGEEYSVKHGEVISIHKNKGRRHSQTIQTSFDRTVGSSGSPIWNQKGEVVAIHYKGSNTSSFELPINYIKDRIQEIQSGKTPQTGDIGLKLSYTKVEDAKKYMKYSESKKEKSRELLTVESVLPNSEAAKQLLPGDIIHSVNGSVISDGLYEFDHQVNSKIGRHLELEVFRFGKKHRFSLKVRSSEREKANEVFFFGGGTFHKITPYLRSYYDIQSTGVYLSQAEKGSTFDGLGAGNKKYPGRKGVVITAIDDTKIMNLNDFIVISKKLKTGQDISITYKDYFYNNLPTFKNLTLDLKTSLRSLFRFSYGKGWVRIF